MKELSNLERQVPCIFCDREFPNTTGKNDAVLHHLLVEHQLVIGDVAQVCDLRRFVLIQMYRGQLPYKIDTLTSLVGNFEKNPI